MKLFRWLLLLPALCGCQLQTVNVDTYFIGPETLASYWVGTPDPGRCCPDVGQELVLTWNMPTSYLQYKDLHIQWIIRFGNHQEEIFHIAVHTKKGEYVYSLINQPYWDRRGIQTYRAEIIGNGQVLKTLCNSVWTTIIRVNEEDKEEAVDWVDANEY